MLHLVIWLADSPTSEQSYTGLLITGVVTITVALIGAWAGRGLRNKEHSSRESEPRWLKDLRSDNKRLRREVTEKDLRIDHYERIMSIWRIDPDTGRRLPDVDEAFPLTPDRPTRGEPRHEPPDET
jgi:hypothetical protein